MLGIDLRYYRCYTVSTLNTEVKPMMRTITLKFPGTCRDCGTRHAAGELARWYGRGRVYGIGCPAKPGAADAGIQWASRRGAAVWGNGICEDAPCCGCCGPNAG